jgi:dienelactone hydrolase
LEKNLAMMATRFHLAMEELKRDPHVDPGKISAIGYCWGGMVVLNMARSGANLGAVVAIAPVLDTTIPAQKDQVVPRILALIGDEDPIAPREKIEVFRKEMTDAGARFEIILYPGVKHAFTQPYADQAGRPGIAYNADADKKSWASLLKLLQEIYG